MRLQTRLGSSRVKVKLFSSEMSREEHATFLAAIEAVLGTLARRANVKHLLGNLNETRICDPALFDPDCGVEAEFARELPAFRVAPINNRWQVEKLTEQQIGLAAAARVSTPLPKHRSAGTGDEAAAETPLYAVPLLHTVDLHLDSRVPTDHALMELGHTLQPFQITNRARAFVYTGASS
jgi:hypothetical protein